MEPFLKPGDQEDAPKSPERAGGGARNRPDAVQNPDYILLFLYTFFSPHTNSWIHALDKKFMYIYFFLLFLLAFSLVLSVYMLCVCVCVFVCVCV